MEHLWAVVLAGGDGARVRSLTRDSRGNAVPKQFCCFRDGRSALSRTLARAQQLAGPRVLPVVVEHQRRWWEPELRKLPPRQVLAQRMGRGTGVAILHGLWRALEQDPDATILVLPSDHDVEDEKALLETLRQAARAAILWPDRVVLVGMEPQADADYGWIAPGAPCVGVPERLSAREDRTLPVLAFLEKPAQSEVDRLVRRGGLCSTFMLAATSRALFALYRRHQCELLEAYARAGQATRSGEPLEGAWLPLSDFSRDILERSTQDVRVLPGLPCGWSDLGTPARLMRWLERNPAAAVWSERPLGAAA